MLLGCWNTEHVLYVTWKLLWITSWRVRTSLRWTGLALKTLHACLVTVQNNFLHHLYTSCRFFWINMSLMRVCVRRSSSIHQGQLVSELMTCRLTGPDTLHDSYATQEWDSMCRMKPNRTSSHRPGCRLNMLRPMSPHHPQSGSPCRQTIVGPAVCYWGILIYSVPLHPVQILSLAWPSLCTLKLPWTQDYWQNWHVWCSLLAQLTMSSDFLLVVCKCSKIERLIQWNCTLYCPVLWNLGQ